MPSVPPQREFINEQETPVEETLTELKEINVKIEEEMDDQTEINVKSEEEINNQTEINVKSEEEMDDQTEINVKSEEEMDDQLRLQDFSPIPKIILLRKDGFISSLMLTKHPGPLAPAAAPKRKRKMLTIAQKVELLDMLKEGKSYAAVGRHFEINESSVRSIKKEEKNIRTTAAVSFNQNAKRVVTVRNKTIVRMESVLALWINDCRKKNITLDTNTIRTKAKKLYETFAENNDVPDNEEDDDAEPGPSSASPTGPTPFNASKGWFDKFQKRFGLKSVSMHGEAASADTDGAEEFVNKKFKAIIEEGGYKPEQVFNMNETGLFWKGIPSRTFIMKDEAKAPGFKAQKDHVTVIMCGNAAGFMIKPGLIYKSKNPRALKHKNKNTLPVYWMHRPAKAWMTKVLTSDWFQRCFIPEVKCYLRQKDLDFKVLLLMDKAGGHDADLSYDGVQIEYLPPNTTSLIQPMDQGIICAFKALYTRNALQHLVEAVDSVQDFSLKAYRREYTIASCLLNIERAIQEMKSENLNACWKKLWPEVVHNKGCSPFDLHHSAVDRAVQLAKQLEGDGFTDMTPDYINSLIEAPSQLLTDEDLTEMTKPTSEEEEEDDTRVEEKEEVGLTLDRLATMVKMANELQRVAQKWDPVMYRSLKFSNIIESGMSVYKNILAQKKKEQQQLPITMFLTRKPTPRPAESNVTDEGGDAAPLEQL
ncbi:tigger transposable element-derived protein 1-like isoform X2 [Poecilia reticulata]|uniref:tigger transposable element-derived protein 1-like isoform X2 n=1 Tax=Poecilia reticulata TaxID=8081 RepID=UPI0007EAACCE|nr:PREDICTED: tigger transposable element-derived protein 1-like isoform X2 [Poecilia reticulata]